MKLSRMGSLAVSATTAIFMLAGCGGGWDRHDGRCAAGRDCGADTR
jgi:hypothetical protein